MREYVVLKSMVKDLKVNDREELLYTIKIENWQQTLREMKFGFQELR